MHITRLRLLGFKSFVEPAELVIERGLTGVVGPNGCGKSNLLEALRWVMGETSYKNMRASSMEDVIFSGTNARPARNIAEVTIHLDNRHRKAHPAFNNDDNLEITRRIERDNGSQYQINGKPVRARDVQLLFADASTGARSPALVQQGRIGEIVSAKPAQRRFILEEAAGITGLHSRRHEAEIKLRGAENNLERLQDIIGQMDTRLFGLKRQERQVKHYRKLTREIEQLQIIALYSDYVSFRSAAKQAEVKLQEVLVTVGEKTTQEAQIRQLHAKAGDEIPALREREMVTAAVMQRLNIESDQLTHEQETQQARKDELAKRRAQYDADMAREENSLKEDQQRHKSFKSELHDLQIASNNSDMAREQASTQVEKTQSILTKGEQQSFTLGTQFAEQKAWFKALEREQLEKQASTSVLHEKSDKLASERRELDHQLSQIADFDKLASLLETKRAELDDLETKRTASEQNIDQARLDESARLVEQMDAKTRLSTRLAEISTLEKLLRSPTNSDDLPVLDEIVVTPGYETALGAALGDDLDASLNMHADLYWREYDTGTSLLESAPALPEGVIPLKQLVTAPKALSPRLEMTGIVERVEGDLLQSKLAAGQRLISIEGDLWRWDGFVARADAPTSAARRLSQKNHLEQLQNGLQQVQTKAEQTQNAAQKAQATRQQLQTHHQGLKNRHGDLRRELEQQRSSLVQAEQLASAQRARLQSIDVTSANLLERHTLETERLQHLVLELAKSDQLATMQKRVEKQSVELTQLRTNYLEAKANMDGLEQENRNRIARIERLEAEIRQTNARQKQAREHVKTLMIRRKEDETELAKLIDLPKQINAKRQALNSQLVKAQEQSELAADQLQRGENTLREINRSLQGLQGQAASARENKAACEARLEAASARLGEQKQLIQSELDCTPGDCLEKAEFDTQTTLPDRAELDRRLAKLTGDRERLGNVNLRADLEARELSEQIEEMSHEHTDLIEAINALRKAISGLNKEGRRRLLNAFDEINAHFEELFTTLFGGGKARLELIESDDPLQAGLEIIASPPGKKPQVLTLLSGGEKALTALSLIFAVFLTNPAPICVLDEVDAPLDDANVERFCTLLDKMTKKTDTRFLIITHHPTTMSHMDRLFGVTMAEKGISQMVSVDLSAAEQYRETA
ncbi:MAG: chromosome segregation protein SMC [bacterium]|nr:chromosome segregation protein SMC [bacterium]